MASELEQRTQSPEGRIQEPLLDERKAANRPASERPPPHDASDALSQLREILVGGAVRELERRLARAEAHMAARAHELEQESRRRLDMIETHMRKESEALTSHLEGELVQTSEAIRAVMREHRESITAADQRVSRLEESLVRAQRELRDQLLQQAKRFLDELLQVRREVAETLEREFGAVEEGFEEGRHAEEERPAP